MIGTTATGFELFWQNYVLMYFAPVLQMLLWIVQIAVFIMAVMLLKRWVDHVTGRAAEKASMPATGEAEPVNVDEFVE